MKQLLIILMVSILSASVAQADVAKGQKIYLKTLKAKFGMNGTKFAAEHTTHEWEDLFADNGKGFIKEYGERFPTSKAFLENPANAESLQHIEDFAKEYSSDSGNVPSCG